MSSGKVYYWLKLNKDFFEDDTVTWIEEQENGKDYIIFYLKLALKSLQDEGYLIRYVGEKLIPYDVKALAKLTNTSPDTVAVAMKLFIEIGLISRLDSGEIYLKQIDEMIGSETDSAKRVRRHRAKKKLLQSSSKVLHCNTDVIKSNTEYRDKSIEIEKEIEIRDIVEYLNEKAGTNYRATTEKTKTLIKARMNEKYTVEDFYSVIDKKTAEWLNTEQEKYLRPETLFGTKFESYLNQKNGKPKSTFEILQAEYEKEVENEQNRNYQITGSN